MLRALQPRWALLLPRAHARALSGAAAAVCDSLFSNADATEAITDLGNPASFFPVARSIERRIVAHLGPTNSGKTHEALEALRRADSGVYAGPLRLLAWQVHDQLSTGGLPCNLVTGQERRDVGARHTACTTEMASTRHAVDVAVIDEIQMLSDESRGWAFTRALLGLPARTLHVCGDPAVLPLLRAIVAETGDHLEVRQYERLSPLAPARRPLEGLDQVQRGDCVVSFSRREVHAVRQEIEAYGRERCCVVYGALPPAARQLQAELFNTPRTGYNVLSASDAVGMGLNLAIRRIVFTSLRKFDGSQERPLTTAEIKQVAGRAGRYGSRFPAGIVTATCAEDLARLADALQQPSEELGTAYILPSLPQLEMLHGQHPGDRLPQLLHRFAEAAQGSLQSTHYSHARYDNVHMLATMLRHLPLSLREAWTFAISPADPADVPVAAALLGLATVFAARRRVTPAALRLPPMVEAHSELELQQARLAASGVLRVRGRAAMAAQLEASHRVLDLYLWLSYRVAGAFAGVEEVAEQRRALAALIDRSIRGMGVLREHKARAAEPAEAADVQIAALAAALERERQAEWLDRRSSYHRKRRR